MNNTEPLASPGDSFHIKWVADGAQTLEEAAERLEGLTTWIRCLHLAGWSLAEPVDGGNGFLVDPSGDAGPDPFEDEEEWDDVPDDE